MDERPQPDDPNNQQATETKHQIPEWQQQTAVSNFM